jgi:hypothetical protein
MNHETETGRYAGSSISLSIPTRDLDLFKYKATSDVILSKPMSKNRDNSIIFDNCEICGATKSDLCNSLVVIVESVRVFRQ